MQLKSFEEFWSTLTEDQFCEIANSVNEQMQAIADGTSNPKNIFGNQIAVCSTGFTKAILKRYHEWLSEQLC